MPVIVVFVEIVVVVTDVAELVPVLGVDVEELVPEALDSDDDEKAVRVL